MKALKRFIMFPIIYSIFCGSFFDIYAQQEICSPITGESITQTLPITGEIRALIIFASFKDRPQNPLPNWTTNIFDPNVPNSLTHYYYVQSGGKYTLIGDVVDHWVYSEYEYDNCLKREKFVRSIFEQVDQNIDFSLYDNWNNTNKKYEPDNIVDMIFINIAYNRWQSEPNLNPLLYETNDTVNGISVKICPFSGSTQDFQPLLENQVGIMAHEYGHKLGLNDLYDCSYFSSSNSPCDFSAGIGFWGLMGEGYGEWGLYSLCEHSKLKLNWVTVQEISKNTFNLRVNPGTVIKVRPNAFKPYEYFLVSYRDHSNFYDRKLPAGLLIWHIDDSVEGNINEFHKQVDLECADGLYSDTGFPGKVIDPISGGDNLDYWAKSFPEYTLDHHGNTFDSTDPFDGIKHKLFTPYSNPNSNGYGVPNNNRQTNISHMAITNIQPGGFCDVIFNYWAGEITESIIWQPSAGTYYLGGDITVPSGVTLYIKAGVYIEYNGYTIRSTGGRIIRDNVSTVADLEHIKNDILQRPISYDLYQNFPNPFNPETEIRFQLPNSECVELTIYNTLGQQVCNLINETVAAGAHTIHWDARDDVGNPLPSGVYLYAIKAGSFSKIMRMILVR